ncbi:MAG: ATP-dependent helicase HrpB [Pseudomonadota bacterium]
MSTLLPIDDVLPDLRAALAGRNRAVLAAPPGAGKTTRVPLALMQEAWAQTGKLLLLEPRRIAARAAAERMASTLGERVGAQIGLVARADVRTSKQVRVEIVTEGVFTRMILDDPSLEGVAGVIFDEFHERSLDADFGLALALETQDALREDLRILVMSATLDTERVATFLDAPVIESQGRAFTVDTRYSPPDPKDKRARIEDQAARAVRRALQEETGSLLVLLPGAAEIRRTAERLSDLGPECLVAPLFGALSPAEQDAAIKPAPDGVRKIVLATDIAESALTIEGVRVVIDAGLARLPRYASEIDAAFLETRRASRANADQRRGRAGRTAPGVCYRLWEEAGTRGLAAHPDPEIANTDLTGLVLDMARWGARAPDDLNWLDPPPEGAWKAGVDGLVRLGALDDAGAITEFGKRIAAFPLPPRLAAMVLVAADMGAGPLGARIAALISERGLGGRSVDLGERLTRFDRETSARAKTFRNLAARWASLARDPDGDTSTAEAGAVLARAFPKRIARARPGKPGEFQLAGGQGCFIDPSDPLASAPWLAVADLTGAAARLRIALAARLHEADALSYGDLETVETGVYNPETTGVQARRVTRLGAIKLEETPLPAPPQETIAHALIDVLRQEGLAILPAFHALEALAARMALLNATIGAPWSEDFIGDLALSLEDWAPSLLSDVKRLKDIPVKRLEDAALSTLEWSQRRELGALAPTSWTAPTGRKIPIDYTTEAGPSAALKVQEVFGLTRHPHIAGDRTPLSLVLLSPAQRPVAQTQDIQGFWTGGYADLRKDMRGRYPKHDWPEDPASAAPQTGAKRRR